MSQDFFAWVCTSQACGRSYPEDGHGLVRTKSPSGNIIYKCQCGGLVELKQIRRMNMPTGTIFKKAGTK